MNRFRIVAFAAVAAICLTAAAPKAQAQVSVGINLGAPVVVEAAPNCPYGYYDYAPYSCSPYGYYGPEWFSGGVFIGAGSWFHGPDNFRGHVNNRYDMQRGYRGARPNVGDRPEPSRRLDKVSHFKGNEMRDGRGHVSSGRR